MVVHVSTAFSYCYRSDIGEVFYEPPITGDRIVKIVDSLDDNTLTAITPTWVVGKSELEVLTGILNFHLFHL
jgi:hypothetical protein